MKPSPGRRSTHLRRTILIPLLLYSDNDAVIAEEEGEEEEGILHSLPRPTRRSSTEGGEGGEEMNESDRTYGQQLGTGGEVRDQRKVMGEREEGRVLLGPGPPVLGKPPPLQCNLLVARYNLAITLLLL